MKNYLVVHSPSSGLGIFEKVLADYYGNAWSKNCSRNKLEWGYIYYLTKAGVTFYCAEAGSLPGKQEFVTQGVVRFDNLIMLGFIDTSTLNYLTNQYKSVLPISKPNTGPMKTTVTKTSGCQHEWVEYVGLLEAYEYCKLCTIPKDKA